MAGKVQLRKSDCAVDMSSRKACIKFNIWEVCLGILAFAYMAFPFNSDGRTRFLSVYDRGLALLGNEMVRHGKVPYRDFFTNYGPSNYWWPVLTSRLPRYGPINIDMALAVAFLVLIYVICRSLLSRELAAVTTFAFVPFAYMPFPLPIVNVFGFGAGLLCVTLVTRYLSRGDIRLLVLAGLATGIETTFRHDFGVYITVTVLTLIALYPQEAKVETKTPSKRTVGRCVSAGWYLFGVSAIVLPTIYYFWVKGAIPDVWYQLFVYPVTKYNKYRGLPYPLPPGPLALLHGHGAWRMVYCAPFYFPFAALTLGLVELVSIRLKRLEWSAYRTQWLVALWMLSVMHMVYAMGRSEEIRVVFANVYCILMAMLVLSRKLLPESLSRWSKAVVYALGVAAMALPARLYLPLDFSMGVALVALVLLTACLLSVWRERTRVVPYAVVIILIALNSQAMVTNKAANIAGLAKSGYTMTLPRMRGFTVYDEDPAELASYERAIYYVRSTVPANEPIFVGNTRHDVCLINDILFYYLAERRPATKYTQMVPGCVTERPVQEEIVREIESQRVRCVVLRDSSHDTKEPNLSARSSGVKVLDRYIATHYHLVTQFGGDAILRRN